MLALLHPHVDLLVLFAVWVELAQLEFVLFILCLVSLADSSRGKPWTTLWSLPFFRLLLGLAVFCTCTASRLILHLPARLCSLKFSVGRPFLLLGTLRVNLHLVCFTGGWRDLIFHAWLRLHQFSFELLSHHFLDVWVLVSIPLRTSKAKGLALKLRNR